MRDVNLKSGGDDVGYQNINKPKAVNDITSFDNKKARRGTSRYSLGNESCSANLF